MKKLILTLCLAATGTFAAVAQMRLTLDQALDLALSENPTIKVAEMDAGSTTSPSPHFPGRRCSQSPEPA